MTGAFSSIRFTSLLYNAHLFGGTGEFYTPKGIRHETPFYYRDHDRLPQLTQAIARSGADFVGLLEIWDGRMAEAMTERLRDKYPYAVTTAPGEGLGGALTSLAARWPRLTNPLMERAEDLVGRFAGRHYGAAKASLVRDYLSEDRIGSSLQSLLRSGPVWGAGLLFLSRHPIVYHRFHAHRLRADWERLAAKGVLEIHVALPGENTLRLSLGHYQEGESQEARLARMQQIRDGAVLTGFEEGPALAMGDFNVVYRTLEYEWMRSTLGLYDTSFGDTYEEPNPYQRKLCAGQGSGYFSRRLDYLFHNKRLWTVSVDVPRKDFQDPATGMDLSDHFPVRAEFEVS